MSISHFVTSRKGVNSFMGSTIPGKGKRKEKFPLCFLNRIFKTPSVPVPHSGQGQHRGHTPADRQALGSAGCRGWQGPRSSESTHLSPLQGPDPGSGPWGYGAVSHGRDAQQWTCSPPCPPCTTPSLLLEFPKALALWEPAGSPVTHPVPRCSPLPAMSM